MSPLFQIVDINCSDAFYSDRDSYKGLLGRLTEGYHAGMDLSAARGRFKFECESGKMPVCFHSVKLQEVSSAMTLVRATGDGAEHHAIKAGIVYLRYPSTDFSYTYALHLDNGEIINYQKNSHYDVILVPLEIESEVSPKLTPFFMVYREGGQSPTYKHVRYKNALTEAERLAQANVGSVFHVLESRSCLKAQAMCKTTDYERSVN